MALYRLSSRPTIARSLHFCAASLSVWPTVVEIVFGLNSSAPSMPIVTTWSADVVVGGWPRHHTHGTRASKSIAHCAILEGVELVARVDAEGHVLLTMVRLATVYPDGLHVSVVFREQQEDPITHKADSRPAGALTRCLQRDQISIKCNKRSWMGNEADHWWSTFGGHSEKPIMHLSNTTITDRHHEYRG